MTDGTAREALRAHSPDIAAARARRWGAFYYAEQVLRVMKGYGWSIIMYSVGHPVAYLFAMGVGLATLVDAQGAEAFGGVGYVTFVAPALLVSASVMTATNEFTFPVMDGFKWRRTYYGPHASPLPGVSTQRKSASQYWPPGHCAAASLQEEPPPTGFGTWQVPL
ncbi:MAG: hypothetical protein ACK4K6_14140, partial [Pseudarthrobacter sp.]